MYVRFKKNICEKTRNAIITTEVEFAHIQIFLRILHIFMYTYMCLCCVCVSQS